MQFPSVEAYLAAATPMRAKGPVALIFAEDRVEIDSTLSHALKAGFREVVLLASDEIAVDAELQSRIHRITCNVYGPAAVPTAVNAIAQATPGVWFYYGFNAEYLFHPFCETRNVRELIAFQVEERREAFLSYVIDLYAADLDRHPQAVSLAEAHLDRTGYYALGRPDPANHNHPRERQLDFFGGLRWRFEEHVPPERRKIDRICLFRATPGALLREDFTFSVEEMNTYACPWHNNITTAVMSFRTAKALKSNPGSRWEINSFRWRNSVPFDWHSQQLMELGLMEPGQWF